MYFRKIEDKCGSYVDENDMRFDVFCARRIRSADAAVNDYVEYDSLETALLAWRLVERTIPAE